MNILKKITAVFGIFTIWLLIDMSINGPIFTYISHHPMICLLLIPIILMPVYAVMAIIMKELNLD